MKGRSGFTSLPALYLVLTMLACTPGAPAPTSTPAEELTEAQVLHSVRSSLADFPWRITQRVVPAGAGQPATSVTEAQSGTRAHNLSMQYLGTELVTMESILIDSTLYLKMIGGPAQAYGLPEGQWTEVQPGSLLARLVDPGPLEPERLAEIFCSHFASLSGDGGSELLFTVVGAETVNGLPTTIYEAAGATVTDRWWVGADGRFYKSILDMPGVERTILVEYDLDFDIRPPIP
jgi:hypothetical protein